MNIRWEASGAVDTLLGSFGTYGGDSRLVFIL